MTASDHLGKKRKTVSFNISTIEDIKKIGRDKKDEEVEEDRIYPFALNGLIITRETWKIIDEQHFAASERILSDYEIQDIEINSKITAYHAKFVAKNSPIIFDDSAWLVVDI